jgi:hypothetical protein
MMTRSQKALAAANAGVVTSRFQQCSIKYSEMPPTLARPLGREVRKLVPGALIFSQRGKTKL